MKKFDVTPIMTTNSSGQLQGVGASTGYRDDSKSIGVSIYRSQNANTIFSGVEKQFKPSDSTNVQIGISADTNKNWQATAEMNIKF